jgi:hypothetical protein
MAPEHENTNPTEWWAVPGQSFDAGTETPPPFWVVPARSKKAASSENAPHKDTPRKDTPREDTSSWVKPPTAPAEPESGALPPQSTPPPAASAAEVSGELTDLLGDVTEKVAYAAELATAVTGTECLAHQSDETVLAVLMQAEALSRYVGAIQASVASIIDDRSPYEAGADGLSSRYGHRRGSYLIEAFARIPRSEAFRRVRVGNAIRSHLTITGENLPAAYPAVAGAIEAGQISVDTSSRIISGLDEARKNHHNSDPASEELWQDSVRAAEAHLVDSATDSAPDTVHVQIVQWREALDPDGAEPREEEIRSRRGFRMGKERNGVARCTWDTTGEDTALLRDMMAKSDASVAPKFYCADDALQLTQNGIVIADADETARLLNAGTLRIDDPNIIGLDPDAIAVVKRTKDLRTREQRHADAIADNLRAGLRAPSDGAGFTRSLASVTAVVAAADLQSGVGVGWLDGVEEPASIATIQQLICNGGVRTAVLGDAGEVLYLGHSRRLFSKAIRTAVGVRDGGCVVTDCPKTPAQCDVHHVIPWSEGGKTDVNNAALLCPEHHRQIHTSAFILSMVNGKPYLLAPRWLDPAQIRKGLGKARHTTRHSNRINV